MKIEFTLTAEDVIAYQGYYLAKSKAWQKHFKFGCILAMIWVLVFMVLPNVDLFVEVPMYILTWLIPYTLLAIAVVLLLVMFAKYVLYPYRMSRFAKKSGQLQGLIGEKSVELTDTGLLTMSNGDTSTISWRNVHSVEQNKDYIFIFLGPMMAYIIPKKAFDSQASADQFFTKANYLYQSAKTANV